MINSWANHTYQTSHPINHAETSQLYKTKPPATIPATVGIHPKHKGGLTQNIQLCHSNTPSANSVIRQIKNPNCHPNFNISGKPQQVFATQYSGRIPVKSNLPPPLRTRNIEDVSSWQLRSIQTNPYPQSDEDETKPHSWDKSSTINNQASTLWDNNYTSQLKRDEKKTTTEQSIAMSKAELSRIYTSDITLLQEVLPNCLDICTKFQFGSVSSLAINCNQLCIPAGTKFGPYTGHVTSHEDIRCDVDNKFMWEIFRGGEVHHFLDASNDQTNWMKHVRCALHPEEQNMVVVQEGEDIYYKADKDIFYGEELKVWYGETYSIYMGIPTNLCKQHGDALEGIGQPGTEGYPCPHCGKIFTYKYYRDKHLKYTRCVDQGNREFPCPQCNRSFDKRDRLRIHVLHVHEKHRPHVCMECGKRFSQSSSLNKHSRVHTGDRPYPCPYCPKAFTASSILRTHIRQHSGEKPFKCCHCGKPFASHAAHDSHVRRTHTKEKPCICSFCGKGFAQSYELKFHINMHTGEKPYKCEKCGRGFSSPSSRDRHRVHFDCTKRKNRAPKTMRSNSPEGQFGDHDLEDV